MAITVNLYAGMERIAGGSSVLLQHKPNMTIEGLLRQLIQQYGDEMRAELVNLKTGEFASSVIIFNGKAMPLLPNLEKQIQDGDEISLITFCAGG
ncbi:MAG: MoaD/ThiS family protein [Bacillota bacterium]